MAGPLPREEGNASGVEVGQRERDDALAESSRRDRAVHGVGKLGTDPVERGFALDPKEDPEGDDLLDATEDREALGAVLFLPRPGQTLHRDTRPFSLRAPQSV